jgi:hypothetical protein
MSRAPQFLKPSSLTNQAAMQREQQRRDDALEAGARVEAMRGSAVGNGGDPPGTAASIMSVHVANADPHVQYALETDVANSLATNSTGDRNRTNHTGTQSLDTTTDSASRLAFLPAERTKLTGIAAGATANSTDAQLRDRATHTGTQLAATISDFAATVLATLLTGLGAGTNAAIAATDSILAAMAKLQAQITARVESTRTISTAAPLTGGGDLSANRTLAISAATTGAAGSMSAADKAKLDLMTNGTYTPTLTNPVNLTAQVANQTMWVRVNNLVTVTGTLTLTPTSNSINTAIRISLPVASNLAATTDLAGVCVFSGGVQAPGSVVGNVLNDVATLNFVASATVASSTAFTFTYTVI